MHNLAIADRRRHAGPARLKPDSTPARQKLLSQFRKQLRLGPVVNHLVANREIANRRIQEASYEEVSPLTLLR
jgi:hypothetical protein